MKNFLMMVVTISFLAIAGGAPVRAQVVDNSCGRCSVRLHGKDSTLPAGKYIIKRTYSADPGLMQIRSADGDEVVVFLVGSAQAAKQPDQTKLIFDRVGESVLPLRESSRRGITAAWSCQSHAPSETW